MSVKRSFDSAFNNIEDEVSFTTQLKVATHKFNWIIKDFEFACKNMKFLESPRFSSANSGKMKWYIRLEPVELKDGNLNIFRIVLKNTGNVPKRLNGKISFCDSSQALYVMVIPYLSNYLFPTWSISGCDLYKKLLCNNSLPKDVTVMCKFDTFDTIETVVKKPLTNYLQYEDLLGQMDGFLYDETFKDVTFVVEEKKFSAHKTILALRSPVFAAMFKCKMSEELSSFVEIVDIKPTIFQKMLCFVYTDKVENLKESAVELLYAAEKYQLEKLKKMCIDNLDKNVTSDTVLKILELADKFLISKLKVKCLEYINSYSEAVNEKEEFLELIKSHPHLAKEICKSKKNLDHNNDVEFSGPTTFQFRSIFDC